MKISTKGRYALRLMLDLAVYGGEDYIPLKMVSKRQEISVKYLEQLITILSRGGFVLSSRGAQGGYKLAKPAQQYTVGDILRLMEGNLAPVACLEQAENTCPRVEQCVTLSVWEKVQAAVENVVDGVTLADLAEEYRKSGDAG